MKKQKILVVGILVALFLAMFSAQAVATIYPINIGDDPSTKSLKITNAIAKARIETIERYGSCTLTRMTWCFKDLKADHIVYYCDEAQDYFTFLLLNKTQYDALIRSGQQGIGI